MAKQSRTQTNLWYVIGAFALLMLFQGWWGAGSQVETIPYSVFEAQLAAGNVAEVTVTETRILGSFRTAPDGGTPRFTTLRVEPGIAEMLSAQGVTFTAGSDQTLFTQLLSWILPVALMAGFWWFVFRRFADRQGIGGLTTIGKSRAKVYVETDTKVTFADVAGVDEAKAELQEMVTFLKEPQGFGRLGARAPKGVLLVGPPGTGKTLLARAVAGEAGVPFFSISGSEFVEMFVGVGAARVRDLFEEARKAAPCIIFIDELDALGRSRSGVGDIGGLDEKEQTLNQLLAELDGFDPRSGVILLAATNRPEVLDPALLRAGRFDRQVLVDRPDRKGRIDILAVHVAKVRLAEGLDLDAVAGLTPGFTGADLANLVNEAALVATRRGAEAVALPDFTEAVERIVAGLARHTRVLAAPDRARVAHHELGHALVASALPGVDPVVKVSIIPRGVGALGYTIQRPTEDRFLIGAEELRNRIAVLLGGRAAEQLVFGEISTGAADDLQRATEIALEMVVRYGMDPVLGHRTYVVSRNRFLGDGGLERREVADATGREIDLAVRTLVDEAFGRAVAILAEHRATLEDGARLLLERETLSVEELPALMALRAKAAEQHAARLAQAAAPAT